MWLIPLLKTEKKTSTRVLGWVFLEVGYWDPVRKKGRSDGGQCLLLGDSTEGPAFRRVDETEDALYVWGLHQPGEMISERKLGPSELGLDMVD